MDLDEFRTTATFRRFKYQRCVYLIRPRRDDTLFGSSARLWLKVGIARTNLWNRLRSYRTYWASGVQVLAVATVRQPDDFEGEAITVVEKHVLSRVRRVRPGCESLRWDQAESAIAAIRQHQFTHEVWTPGTEGRLSPDTEGRLSPDTEGRLSPDTSQVAEPGPVAA